MAPWRFFRLDGRPQMRLSASTELSGTASFNSTSRGAVRSIGPLLPLVGHAPETREWASRPSGAAIKTLRHGPI